MINKFISICIGIFFMSLCACTTTKTNTDAIKANITATDTIVLPKFSSSTNATYEQLVSTTYDSSKHSIICIVDIKDNEFHILGLSPTYINLFELSYKDTSLQTKYYVPQKMLPPVNQVLLDMLLAFDADDTFKDVLPSGFTIKHTDTTKVIRDSNSKEIYVFSYALIKNEKVITLIENKEFNYTIDIKYL